MHFLIVNLAPLSHRRKSFHRKEWMNKSQGDSRLIWKPLLVFLTALVLLAMVLLVMNGPLSSILARGISSFDNGETQLIIAPQQASSIEKPSGFSGSYPIWSKVEISLRGLDSDGMSNQSNPYKIAVDVTFSGPNGEKQVVPAFYDGNGSGNQNGNVWKVRFSPGLAGKWIFTSKSSQPLLDNITGSFDVLPPANCQARSPGSLPDFRCTGRLNYTGEYYLRFANGDYWIKAGADDPEDFLAPETNAGFNTKTEAIDYLASKGINSMYILLSNVGGDANNVWPWVGSNPTAAKSNHEHFDLVKLAEWEEIFTYIQNKGLVLHLVLEDDSAWNGFNRTLYYREMIARFSHHNGLIWNISEEFNENYSPNQAKGFARMIKGYDPYDHPVTVHHAGSTNHWVPFIGHTCIDMTSLQTDLSPQNDVAVTFYNMVKDSGRVIPVSFDETGKIASNARELSRHILWSVYLGGANFELHTFPLSDYRDFNGHFEDLTFARAFLEGLHFWQMVPANNLLLEGNGYVFARQGAEYAIYMPAGGSIELDLRGATGALTANWYNPRTGVFSDRLAITGGVILSFTPPFTGDAVLYVGNKSSLEASKTTIILDNDLGFLPLVVHGPADTPGPPVENDC